MNFGWINGVNTVAVVLLIIVNVIAVKKGMAEDFRSKYPAINIFEQIGRYGSMAFMIFPVLTKGWKFGFTSVAEMLIWLCGTVLLLVVYVLLWMKKSTGGANILYGLAVVPTMLFLMNGIFLRHPMLIAASLIFGVFHITIVKENIHNGIEHS